MADSVELIELLRSLPAADDGQELAFDPVANKLVRKSGSTQISFGGDKPILYDNNNTLGGGIGIYVPRNVALVRGSVTFNGQGGPASAVLSDYWGIGVDPGKLVTIYFDLDQPQKYQVAVFPNPVPSDRPAKVFIIATIYQGQVLSDLPVLRVDGGAGPSARVVPASPLVVEQSIFDGTFILIPSFFYIADGVTVGFDSYNPANNGTHFGITLPSDPGIDWRLFFDRQAADRGSPFRIATADNAPVYGGARHILLAQSISGVVTPGAGFSIVGGPLGGVARNQCPITMDANLAVDFYNSTNVDIITEPNLTKFGFFNGARDVVGKRPYYGCDLQNVIPGGSIFVRFHVQTDTAEDFGVPAALLIDKSTGGSISSDITMRREFRRSSTASSYIGRLNLPLTLPKNLILRVGSENPNGRDLRITGLQYAITRERSCWIARDDLDLNVSLSGALSRAPAALSYVTPESAVLGPDLYMIQGQRLPLRLTNCFSRRTEGKAISATLTSMPATVGGSSYTVTGEGALVIEADRVGPAARLSLRSLNGFPDIRAEMGGLRCWVSPSSGYTTSPKILLIGDSLTNRRIAAFLDAKLRRMGMTPVFLGTINGQGLNDADAGGTAGPLGEGREGWQFSDYIFQTTRFGGFGTGSEGAYNGQSKPGKVTFNPFIRTATGSDPAGRVYNNSIFDFGFYLSRFSMAVPDYVLITLGQNDETLAGTPAAATQQVLNGLGAMIPSIRAAGANIRIGVGLHTRPRGSAIDEVFANYRYPSIQAITKYVRTLGDAKTTVVPFWQHMDENAPWDMLTVRAPDNVSVARTVISDSIHFLDEQRHVVSENIRGWIAKGESGGTSYAPEYLIKD